MPGGSIRYRKRIKRIEPIDPSVLDNKYRHALQRVATNFLAEVSGTTLNHGVRIWVTFDNVIFAVLGGNYERFREVFNQT